ncbi:helix-turn-helix domain-containing protein [Terasakiella pusilla]|uniref:helix-turn-helix domain-containing protein n=1 Tax=Terasakiella pusilla TaxID=64973 RepID=UPI003AA9A234
MTQNQIITQFGRTIRKLRKAKQMTQEQLAEAIDCNVDTISNIERGATSARLENLAALARVFEIEIGELFDHQPRNLSPEILHLMQLLEDQPGDVVKTVTEQAKVLIRHKR